LFVSKDVAVEREVEGDLLHGDMGCGMPFRAGTFDGVIRYDSTTFYCYRMCDHVMVIGHHSASLELMLHVGHGSGIESYLLPVPCHLAHIPFLFGIARSADCCNSHGLTVHLSVTFRCFVQSNEDKIVRSSASDTSIIIVSGEVNW